MSLPTETKQYILANKPTDLPSLSGPSPTFSLETTPLPPLNDDQVLVQTHYISNDPAQRGWISKYADPKRLYVPPVPQGAVMRSRNVCEVLDSKTPRFSKGDIVLGNPGWTEYAVVDASTLQKAEKVPGLSETQFLGALGLTGITAYYGLTEIAKAGPEDAVVVSGAAGATGSMVVQIAKHILGCKRVIGMAGEEGKCRWVESLGADVCLNYKDEAFKERLKKETEDFVEVYFDNVGGEILDLMLTRMKRHGRVAACGAITQYNKSKQDGIKNWFQVISMRLEIRGFIVFDYMDKAQQAVGTLVKAFKEGKIRLGDENETIVDTKFEDVPGTWMKLFEGGNTGKLVTKLV
ncbi:uncharacterized protein KY384_000955 [Bacidia gigantensis]|uniref:uncharacterized protein n=1 Tax=Bacidia gigantensis TaxID=2732470 RepID=UPI001D04F2D5|nr:uncharacterized protein KY384_000955 [Bacidia gigantensis]KAG8534111.1 hypothetical protein KY384_000955 [Bacidia gigantensis]